MDAISGMIINKVLRVYHQKAANILHLMLMTKILFLLQINGLIIAWIELL